MSPVENADRARALIGEALCVARVAMVGRYEAGDAAQGRAAEAAADLLHEASTTLAVAMRGGL